MKNFTKNEKHLLIVVFILSIIIRILYLLFIEKPYEVHTEYMFLGNLFSNGDFLAKTADESKILVGSGIPLIYALLKTLFSEPFYSFVIYNLIASSLIVIGLFYLGKELFSNKTGLLLAIWGMIYPESIRYIGGVLKEPTLLTLIPFFILVFVKSLKRYHYLKIMIAAALLFSMLIHIDERFFIYLPLLLIAIYVYKRKELSKKFRIKKLGILFGLIIIFMLPWCIRNYLVYNQVVLLTPRTISFTSFFLGWKLL